ncbi:hypothetical protein CROQUDRAFT_199807 [Cronartium quercuum f. sp. fusiforme G11]|uniref:Uncharacterized protein n=1 Tax=Cronartium quercuum f. sp. fusiforme G11 TaxID=708437 RepID=A0A9P6NUG6_9BASI|nr:hypothetical protein CROQUDRAFT_199807 [Cronartium quercuum f. sp. fusiforme G11]
MAVSISIMLMNGSKLMINFSFFSACGFVVDANTINGFSSITRGSIRCHRSQAQPQKTITILMIF